jgi:serine/threonine protein kinase
MHPWKPGDLVDTRYRIEEMVASGGMGTVYRAFDTLDQCQVAVKFMRQVSTQFSARFAREAEVLMKLDHPGIVRIVGFGTAENSPYIAMEWVEGSPLSRRLSQTGLSAGETIRLGRQLAIALAEVHRHGFVHRDIKPGNILLEHNDVERPKVVDFGIARQVIDEQPLTRTGMLVGTTAYMAPEQALGAKEIDGRADLFALGCVLYHALAGRPPFQGRRSTAVRAKVLLFNQPSLEGFTDVPPELHQLVSQLLSKRAAERPESAEHVVGELEKLMHIPVEGPRRTEGDPQQEVETRTFAVDGPPAINENMALPLTWVLMMSTYREGAEEDADGEGTDSSTHPSPKEAGRAILRDYPFTVEVFNDMVVGILHSERAAAVTAVDVAHAALQLQNSCPDAPIVLATGLDTDELLERAAGMLQEHELQVIFAPPGGHVPICIDAAAAKILSGKFQTGNRGAYHYLYGATT